MQGHQLILLINDVCGHFLQLKLQLGKATDHLCIKGQALPTCWVEHTTKMQVANQLPIKQNRHGDVRSYNLAKAWPVHEQLPRIIGQIEGAGAGL